MIARVLAAAVLVVAAILGMLALWPQLFNAERTFGIAQIVSLRGAAAAIAILGAVSLTLLALLAPLTRRLVASLALLLLLFAAGNAAVLSSRGFGGEGFETKAETELTVLSWNTLGDAPGVEGIVDLALDARADVVALPETTLPTAQEAARLLGEAGKPMWPLTVAFDEVSKARSTSLLISAELGEYRVDDSLGNTGQLPSLVAVPVDGEGPMIVAAHPVAPIREYMRQWRLDLEWLAGICARENVIVAGDFNATVDHMDAYAVAGELGDCRDAALATDAAAVGTWPTFLPPLLGAPIDHVMATPNWQFTGMRVIESRDDQGSDHRPVLAQLRPAG
ncbi:endonuclease/exonuclease/phosphatase family protein [Lysobacter korlensis]|uniref:Endonuclease/exonuclease/phosphatase family protein n=1 Tax=Lysobacter korlensis TaxID=553636 RepID=A0ABV6RZ40_9GAMM